MLTSALDGLVPDYPDPYDWINILLYGKTIEAENNVNYSYFNHPKWNKRMENAAKLVGPKRARVYGQMDIDIMKQAAPVAAERTYNNRYFFSNRVNPKADLPGHLPGLEHRRSGSEVGGSRVGSKSVGRRFNRRPTSFR